MATLRWWHAAVIAVSLIVGAVAVIDGYRQEWRVAGVITLVVFVLAWFTVGRLAGGRPRLSLGYAVFLVIISGVLVAFDPNFATMQTITYPILWTIAPSVRTAIATSTATAVSVFFGLIVSLGTDSIGEAAIIAALSLGFAIGMGTWISRIWKLSDERLALVEQLQAAQTSLAALSRDAGVTSERERLAREIHDTIAQDLTGLVLLSQQSRRSLAAGDVSGAEQQLALLEESARLALSETRSLVAATSPAALDDGGIGPALQRLAQRFERETGIRIPVEVDVTAPLDRATEVVLLRCAQEGLANVRKHAGASSAALALTVGERGITLTLEDDGSGFDPASVGQGYGISGMRDRLALVSGSLDLETSPAGTRLIVTLPGALS
ncbi:sensor histidine kinase [Glaciihabitans arcticus]|uniref:histidine kinase n=1 Tax=Glaciihabitans arcticus TaxID=2668039 RepID=A0A4Q9GMC8_9MICO|nr:sensor histidine kinase [Glaciihabitans arcticus]TBN55513.1 sensor histidine kinase [Glaciihabitans arcticus]